MTDDVKVLLQKSVNCLKGVGEVRTRLFYKLGLYSVEDVLTHFPRQYEDRSKLKKIAGMEDGEQCSFEGVIASGVTDNRSEKRLLVSRVTVRDDTGFIRAVWFNQPHIKKTIKTGDRYVFFGRVTINKTREVLNPVFEKLDEKGLQKTCRIIPVYPSTGDLSQSVFRAAIQAALDLLAGRMDELLPGWVRSKYFLSEINYSIYNIHFPKSDPDFRDARYRLVFEELFLLQLGLFNIKISIQSMQKGVRFGAHDDVCGFISRLPFKLTNAQIKVINEIEADMESNKVMDRLVQGDVGSGKTVVAAVALYKAVKSGYQGTLMAPTEILAVQHYHTINGLFEGYGIRIAVLKGSMPKKARQDVLEDIKKGNIDIVIGTHALLEEDVVFARLGLAVTDEQHRFGVRQRMMLSAKGLNPDILVMTATPIPRSLALILYGDLDISAIDELPPGRKNIGTFVVDDSMRERVDGFIRKNVGEGRQAYIVCPLVDESNAIEAKAATGHARRIAVEEFNGLKVGLVHGKMRAAEKKEAMDAFARGETDILVSTTLIEVGVNVPNASVMVVEDAGRFGLAQLHQLRGRVGRGGYQSYCILYNNSKSALSKERLKVLTKTCDGFVIL